jgi:hypothetical protein
MVDHDRQLGEPLGEDRNVVEVTREHDRKLEDDASVLQQLEALEDAPPEDPVWISLVVDEMPDRTEGRALLEVVKPVSRPPGVVERQPGGNSRDPFVLVGLREEIVRVGVEAGPLDEDDRVDAVAVEQGAEITRPERSRDRLVLGRHPRLWRVRRIPEMNVRVDDHPSVGS